MSFSLADSLSKTNISELIGSVVEEGDVYRMCLDGREGIVGKDGAGSRNKFFVLIGKDSEGNAFGFFLINTNIYPSLPEVRKQKHIKLLSENYDFLEGRDRYVDCSDFKIIKKERFATMFSAKKSIAKISNEDIALIKSEATTYRNANRKQLRRFGLIK